MEVVPDKSCQYVRSFELQIEWPPNLEWRRVDSDELERKVNSKIDWTNYNSCTQIVRIKLASVCGQALETLKRQT